MSILYKNDIFAMMFITDLIIIKLPTSGHKLSHAANFHKNTKFTFYCIMLFNIGATFSNKL